MRIRIKRTYSLLLIAVGSGMAACGGDDAAMSRADGSEAGTASTAASSSASPAEAGSAASAEPDGQATSADASRSGAPARYLFAWVGDADRADSDFLAVLDADPDSPDYGSVITTLPVDRSGTMPHHTEHRMPESRHLFANGFMTGTTFRFDLTNPESPELLGSFGSAGEFTHPHSYERLPNGNLLATFQGQGEQNVDPGGLVELTDGGDVVRTSSAARGDSDGADADGTGAGAGARDPLLRPYSLAILPDADRVVVTSYDMGEDMGFEGGRRERTHIVQVWRLSDLEVLATIDLPPGPGGGGDEQPGEPRVLSDGETVYVATFTCGLYRMRGLNGGAGGEGGATEAPSAEFVHGFGGGGCALPVVLGDYWIQSVPSANAVVALDVSDPARPREVSRVTLGSRNFPHWLALDAAGGRIVVADRGDGERRLFVLTVDGETGELVLDEEFRDPGSDRAGVDFGRREWPHGATGAATPHGTVFGG